MQEKSPFVVSNKDVLFAETSGSDLNLTKPPITMFADDNTSTENTEVFGVDNSLFDYNPTKLVVKPIETVSSCKYLIICPMNLAFNWFAYSTLSWQSLLFSS